MSCRWVVVLDSDVSRAVLLSRALKRWEQSHTRGQLGARGRAGW